MAFQARSGCRRALQRCKGAGSWEYNLSVTSKRHKATSASPLFHFKRFDKGLKLPPKRNSVPPHATFSPHSEFTQPYGGRLSSGVLSPVTCSADVAFHGGSLKINRKETNAGVRWLQTHDDPCKAKTCRVMRLCRRGVRLNMQLFQKDA